MYKLDHELVTISFCLMTCSINRPSSNLKNITYTYGWESSLTMLKEGICPVCGQEVTMQEELPGLILQLDSENRVGGQNCECLFPAGLKFRSATSWANPTILMPCFGTINKDIRIWIPWHGIRKKVSHLAAAAGLSCFNWPFFLSYLFFY